MLEILSLFVSLYSIYDILHRIHEDVKKDQEKRRIIEELMVPLDEAEDALSSLIVNIYTVVGAYFIGYKIEPPHPEIVANNLSKGLAGSYENATHKLKLVAIAFTEYEDELKEMFGKDRVIIERFISAFGGETPDLTRLMSDKRITSKFTQTGGDHIFIGEMGKGLNQYQSGLDIEIFGPVEDLGKIVFVDHFDEILALIMKIQADYNSKSKKGNVFKPL